MLQARACALTRVAPPPQHQTLQCSSCCSCSLQAQPTRGGGRRRCALKRIERCFATCRAKYIKRALFQTFTYCPPPAPRCVAARALCSAAVTSPHARRRNRTSISLRVDLASCASCVRRPLPPFFPVALREAKISYFLRSPPLRAHAPI